MIDWLAHKIIIFLTHVLDALHWIFDKIVIMLKWLGSKILIGLKYMFGAIVWTLKKIGKMLEWVGVFSCLL